MRCDGSVAIVPVAAVSFMPSCLMASMAYGLLGSLHGRSQLERTAATLGKGHKKKGQKNVGGYSQRSGQEPRARAIGVFLGLDSCLIMCASCMADALDTV